MCEAPADRALWPCARAQDFLKNNRGINDGADLPEGYMCDLYDRIQTNEIKMKAGARCRMLLVLPPEPCVLPAACHCSDKEWSLACGMCTALQVAYCVSATSPSTV